MGLNLCENDNGAVQVTSEALRVCREMVRVIRPDSSVPIDASLRPVVVALFDSAMARLGAQDQDQEVKECAIKCAAVSIKHLGDILPEKVSLSRLMLSYTGVECPDI